MMSDSSNPLHPEFRFQVRPITEKEYERVNSKCWDNSEVQKSILRQQGILGFGAWDTEERCIAQLHCYRVSIPDWDDRLFPDYARNRLLDCPLGWPLLAAKEAGLFYGDMPVLVLSCFHVGLLPGCFDEDPRYFRKGIGKALLHAIIDWARTTHRYAAILAHGGSNMLPAYNIWMGSMPWTSYREEGFLTVALEEGGESLPWWKDKDQPELSRQLADALAKGYGPKDLNAHLMVLEL